MRKLYGKFGYIDFVPEPSFEPAADSDQIDLTLTADEGKQFFIRRIDFSGNTTTRDKVIRREILLDEGDMFNTELWDYSILRLNQLGYFEMLKKEEAADIKRNPQSNTVDITLKVKERGKNSVGLNGGVSGIAGSFVGFNYSTTSSDWAKRSLWKASSARVCAMSTWASPNPTSSIAPCSSDSWSTSGASTSIRDAKLRFSPEPT
jgi:outer membrane protein insertion porin family